MYVRFLHVFSWLDITLRFGAISLPRCTTFYLNITCRRTSWLLLSFGSYEYSCCKHLCTGFCVDVSFELIQVNTKGHSFVW